jgi:hypothetical protein
MFTVTRYVSSVGTVTGTSLSYGTNSYLSKSYVWKQPKRRTTVKITIVFSVRHYLDFAVVLLQVGIVFFPSLFLCSLFIRELFYVTGYTGTCVTMTIRTKDSEDTNWYN